MELSEVAPDPRPESLIGRDPTGLTVKELVVAMDAGVLSYRDVLSAFRRRVESINRLVNAFIWLTSSEHLGAGQPSPLRNVPYGAKDVIETAGIPTTAGSKQLLGYVPDADAEVIEAFRTSGAVLLGKLNTHEFAAGATGDNPHFGAVRNPWNRDRIAGGSSSGSAAAVAARLLPFALGTDTAGSVRIPATLCGVIGFKPAFGLISCKGVIPEAWSLDHVGLLTRSVADLPLLLSIAMGKRNNNIA